MVYGNNNMLGTGAIFTGVCLVQRRRRQTARDVFTHTQQHADVAQPGDNGDSRAYSAFDAGTDSADNPS